MVVGIGIPQPQAFAPGTEIGIFGTEFGNVFKVFPGAARGTPAGPGLFETISDYFKRAFTPSQVAQKTPGVISKIFTKKGGVPAESPTSVSGTNNPPLRTLAKPLAAATAVTAVAVGGTLIALTPGGQDILKGKNATGQAIADTLKLLAESGGKTIDFFTNNPLILVALIGLGAVLVIKK